MDGNNAVAIYVRVSTEQQVDGFSLEAQEEVLRQDVKRRGKWVYQVYKDAGVSGAKAEREGLGQLMADARQGRFGEVLVWKVSRVSRRLHLLLKLIEELDMIGIAFRSHSERFDAASGIGKFSLTMLGAVAQMQRESWMESSRIGSEKRFRSGRWNGGRVFGYRSVPDPDDPRGGTMLTVVPGEAEVVRRIFELYDEGLGYKRIVRRLNDEGCQTLKGDLFSVWNIKSILENPVYIGLVRFAGERTIGIHQPIINRELWNKVQERKGEGRRASRMVEREYLLSGLLRCPECGGPMVPIHKNKVRGDGSRKVYHYYQCAANLNKGKAACHANLVMADRIETAVLDKIMMILSDPYWTRQVVETILQTQTGTAERVDPDREAKITEVTRRKRDLLLLFENEKISLNDFKARMMGLKEKETALGSVATPKPAPKPEHRLIESQIRKALQSMRKVFNAATTRQKRSLI